MFRRCLVSAAALVLLAALLPTPADAQLLWSMRVSCGVDPHVPIGLWYSVVSLHNHNAAAVTVDWQTLTEDGGVVAAGSFDLGPDEVEEIDCFELPYDLPPSGFFEIQARRLIQVVATQKNIEVSEVYEDKGYYIPPHPVGPTWTYTTEFACGDLAPLAPGSVADLLEDLTPEEKAKVWRPGRAVTNFFVYNPTASAVRYTFRIVRSDGETLAFLPGQVLGPREARRFDCDDLPPPDGPEPRLAPAVGADGVFVVEAESGALAARFDLCKYLSVFSAGLEVEYPRPIRRRLAAGAAGAAVEPEEGP